MSEPNSASEFHIAMVNKAIEIFRSLPDEIQIEIMDEYLSKTNLGSLEEIVRVETEGELQFDPEDENYPNK